MAKEPRRLAGQVVAITGAGRGIGRATAEALLRHGAKVAIGDIDTQLAERAAAEIGAGTVGLHVDVTGRGSFATFLDAAEERLGPLDVLINNAGIMPVGRFIEESDATAARMVDINLHGVILGSKLALERFLARGSGHLVNIASAAGKSGFPHAATYCATKHAVVGLSDSIRWEVRGTDIAVSVVMPVGVNTELYSGLDAARGFKKQEPEDVANAIVEALQHPHFDVYVPKALGIIARMNALFPRAWMDVLGHFLKGDQVLVSPDHAARAAYERRLQQTIAPAADREQQTA
jgi:NADP-dependent 3-hydroxy acid dehydrogenase YdfG